MCADGECGLQGGEIPIFQPAARGTDTQRTMQCCTRQVCQEVQAAFSRVFVFDSGLDSPLEVKLLRSGKDVRKQTVHSDFAADSIVQSRPQRSAMLALHGNTHIMLADGSAVVVHR